MDQGGLNLEPEVCKVLEYIREGKNFLLSGGAGSGKTYSLVQVIGELLRRDQSASIACITYTNAAVHEIESRIANERLWVSTIHDFLWDAISSFQEELRSTLFDLISCPSPKIKIGTTVVAPGMFAGKEVQYKEYKILSAAIISHDEVIVLAREMFERYSKLRDILRDRYRYVMVDEYQDTAPAVVQVLLDLLPTSKRQGVSGFFGDSMQSIYDDTVGSLHAYVAAGEVAEVKKEQNRRNPRLIFELANQLRSDGLVQRPSLDEKAPNMTNGVVKEGDICFYYSNGEVDRLDDVRKQLAWNFDNVSQTRELNLTHNLIAPQAGFPDLMEIYDADQVIAYRERVKDFIKKNGGYGAYDEMTFSEVIAAVGQLGTAEAKTAVRQPPKISAFIVDNKHLFDAAGRLNFQLFRKMHVNKDQLVDDKKQSEEEISRKGSKRCAFIKHVFKIQKVLHLYEHQRYNEFLRKTEFTLRNAKDKIALKELIDAISHMTNRPVFEVIDFANEHGLCVKDDNLREFIEKNSYLHERVRNVKYQSFQNLYEYLEGRTTYSTQHKIKGREFDQVLVVLDNGGWSKYNFNYLFEGGGTDTVRTRTEKLFYVCCTRAKDSLAVYFKNPSEAAVKKAQVWFGDDNVIKL